jgi:tetratricopeptide (TPR) repeat protein
MPETLRRLMLATRARLAALAVPRRVLIWGALLAAFSLGIGFVPLFNLLGYDYAFALGLLAAVASVDVGHAIGARARLADPRPPLATTALRAAGWGLALLLAPLCFGLLQALRVRNCNLGAGLAFFALLPVGTMLFGAPLGAAAGFAFLRRGRVVAMLLPLGSILWTVLRLYVDPPAFALDPFGGFFPGPIYDEALEPPARLFYFRLVNLVWAAAAVAVTQLVLELRAARLQKEPSLPGDRRRVGVSAIVALVLTTASGILFAQRGPLGFHVDKAHLLTVLRRQSVSPHFVVWSDPTADGTPEDRGLMLRDLEFRYGQLQRVLGVQPAGPVTVYLFASGQQKKDLVGAGGTLYAKPWTREIFVQTDRFPARHLRHELAHVFAGAFGDPIFGISLSWRWPLPRLASGLVEGIAEAADYGDPDGRATVHQEARAMIAAGLAPPLAQVVGAGFTTVAGARAYTLAGSFAHYLLLTYGPAKLRALYQSGGDFSGVYGQPFDKLEADWRGFLETQPLDAQEKARARERFRRPAIFQKVCARDIAARVDAARGQLYSMPEQAVQIFRTVCDDDPAEPGYRLFLAEALAAAGSPDQALTITSALERDEQLTDPVRARAATLAASVHYHAGRFDEALAATRRAAQLATDEGEQRTGIARQRALTDPVARATLGRILFGDSPTRGVDPALVVYLAERFARDFPSEALGPYMLGRQLAFRDPKLALPPLLAACPLDEAAGALPVPLTPAFRTECHRLVGEAAYRAGDFTTSRKAWQRLADDAPTLAEKLRATDFLERLQASP